MFPQPLVDLASGVRGQVVHDHMDLLVRIPNNHVLHKFQELHGASPLKAPADHLASLGVQCREQIGRAVPYIVMSPLLGLAKIHRQQRLCPIQRLNLGLLVHRQHHRAFRRIQIQPDYIGHLHREIWIIRQLESALPMRLQTVFPPQHRHKVVRHRNPLMALQILRHLHAGPMRQPSALRRRFPR